MLTFFFAKNVERKSSCSLFPAHAVILSGVFETPGAESMLFLAPNSNNEQTQMTRTTTLYTSFQHQLYGRYIRRGPLTLTFSTRCGKIRSYTSFTHSHKSGLVSRGSMISGTSKISAVRIGDRIASNLAIRLSYNSFRLSPAASSSRRYAAWVIHFPAFQCIAHLFGWKRTQKLTLIPPSKGRLPQSPEGHDTRMLGIRLSTNAAPATPNTLRKTTVKYGTSD